MKTLIYSHLYVRPGASHERTAALRESLDLWLNHLRGPGRYAGDILLFTNDPEVTRPGLILRPIHNVPMDPQHAFLQRVLTYQEVPAADYDVAMQMDLDILAVDDVNPLFPHDERLWAARSDLATLDWRHAWTLIPLWRRLIHKCSRWRMSEQGVSACLVASASSTWERNFGAWARAIRAHGDRPLPRQADQSFLNLLFLEGTIPMASWPAELIRHRDWDQAVQARLLHFPGSRKAQMQRFRKV
jgi:hypothetical protein